MPSPQSILVGTSKGAFVLRDGAGGWQVSGPHCNGWPINHVVGCADTGALYAGGGNDWFGAGVFRSSDGGATWTLAKLSSGKMDQWAAADPDFAAMIGWQPGAPPFDDTLKSVWSLHAAHGWIHAGTDPAQLLTSGDGGATWHQNAALAGFHDRATWNPGAVGLVLHSIATAPEDPAKLWLAISAAGVFASEDGGDSWDRRNRLSNVAPCNHSHHPAAPSKGETGHCVHNIARGPGDVIYQQNHHGVFRSPDGGRNWQDVTTGLPSTFGFPIGLDPEDAQTIWTVPLNGDMEGRFPPDAAAAVWRSSDGGDTWQAQRHGLPQNACYFTVLRQAMATAPGHVAFGTNTGSIFLTRDRGETWDEVARHLPTVLSVEMTPA